MTTVQSNYGSSSVNTLLTGHTKEAEEKKDPLGREAFLNMLIAQLKHQDPLNPLEGTDFTAQLAQFSMLEQQFNTNDNLEALLQSMSAKREDNLIEYIGKEVSGTAETMVLKGGKASGGMYTMEEQAEVSISIFNSEGREVRTLYAGQKGAGSHQIQWDGTDNDGQTLADGTYTYEVTALDAIGGFVPVKTSVIGEVTGVTYENGTAYLEVGDKLLDPVTVRHVWKPAQSGADAGQQDAG
ncbi:MAG: flagellar hook assembly protein FlgD [Thermodesulfobacteriota bacterium]